MADDAFKDCNRQYSTLVSNPELGSNGNNDNGTAIQQATARPMQSFLEMPKSYNESIHSGGNTAYYNPSAQDNNHLPGNFSSPTPVLLSSPYSKNNTFQQHHIHTLPIPNAHSSISRKRSDNREVDEAHTNMENKKYRSLLESTDPSVAPAFVTMTTPPTKPKGSGRGRKPANELLSEDQKKANHIASEQKRRANIRIGFDQLVELVPNLTDCQRSESLILQKSVDYIRQLVETKNTLRDRVREMQTALGEIPDEDSSEGELDYGF